MRYLTMCINPVECINTPNGLAAIAVLHISQLEPNVSPNSVLRPELEGVGEEPDLEWHLLRCKECTRSIL